MPGILGLFEALGLAGTWPLLALLQLWFRLQKRCCLALPHSFFLLCTFVFHVRLYDSVLLLAFCDGVLLQQSDSVQVFLNLSLIAALEPACTADLYMVGAPSGGGRGLSGGGVSFQCPAWFAPQVVCGCDACVLWGDLRCLLLLALPPHWWGSAIFLAVLSTRYLHVFKWHLLNIIYFCMEHVYCPK